ncbi:MAG: arylesterase, partial [Proteobacteria bacterium]|nr:arylesterase [Pseudomonadota bacterium]
MSDAPQLTIAAFGDSLFEGWGLMPDQSVPAQLEKLLRQEGRNLRMLNFGVSGETAGEGLLRVDQVVKAKPDLALLEFGANDFYQLVDPEETQDQLAAIIETFQAKAI